jgi:hypothetical protein
MARCSCQPPNWGSNRGAKHRTATFDEVSDRSSCARGGTTFTPLSGLRAQSQAHRVESQSSRALSEESPTTTAMSRRFALAAVSTGSPGTDNPGHACTIRSFCGWIVCDKRDT